MFMGRYRFDFKKLLDHGIVFITQAHDLSTGEKLPAEYDPESGEYYEDSTNLLTLYNIKNPEKGLQDYILKAMRSPRPDQAEEWTKNQDDLIDEKYQQILWGINYKNMRPEDFTIEAPKKEIRRINDIIGGQDAYKQKNTPDYSMYDTQRFPYHESIDRTKKLMRVICEINDPYGNVIRIYPNGGGSDPGDNVPKWGVQMIDIKDTIPNEPFKDLSYMDSSDNAQSMIDSIKKGENLPPVLVIRHPYDVKKYLVVDGNHRRYAYKKAGASQIPAEIIKPEDILLMSKEWGSKDNKATRLSDVEDSDVVDLYFVNPDGGHKFEKSM